MLNKLKQILFVTNSRGKIDWHLFTYQVVFFTALIVWLYVVCDVITTYMAVKSQLRWNIINHTVIFGSVVFSIYGGVKYTWNNHN